MQASARLSSSAASRKVIASVSSATARSCYRTSRGKAHAAPLPAQEPPPKGKKRITPQERRVRMVEFIENYRASNDGKFPTMKHVQDQVGGGHYTVRAIVQEMKANRANLVLDTPQDTVVVNEHSMTKDGAEVAQIQGTIQVSKDSFPKDEDKVAQCQETIQFHEQSRPKDDREKAVKHDTETSETCETADSPVLSDQTERERMKDLADNQQKEMEANKFDLKNSEEVQNAYGSNASDQSGRDMVNEANMDAREDNPKLEEPANTGLLGSLKSFAYGIRNFWKNM